MKQLLVVGLGRFGGEVARALANSGYRVTGLDSDAARVQSLSETLEHLITGDATDGEVLKGIGAKGMDCAVVSVGTDLESSVLITLNLKELGVKKVAVKAIGDLHKKILMKVGADMVFFPEREAAAKLAEGLLSDNILDVMDLGTDCRIVELVAGEEMAGKTLGQLCLRQRFGVNVVAVKHNTSTDLSPQADSTIARDDVLVIIGPSESVRGLKDQLK